MFFKRIPAANVIPLKRSHNSSSPVCPLRNRIIYGNCRGFGIGFIHKIPVLYTAKSQNPFLSRQGASCKVLKGPPNFRLTFFYFIQKEFIRKRKHAAVPIVAALFKVLPCSLKIRLFLKIVYIKNAFIPIYAGT